MRLHLALVVVEQELKERRLDRRTQLKVEERLVVVELLLARARPEQLDHGVDGGRTGRRPQACRVQTGQNDVQDERVEAQLETLVLFDTGSFVVRRECVTFQLFLTLGAYATVSRLSLALVAHQTAALGIDKQSF